MGFTTGARSSALVAPVEGVELRVAVAMFEGKRTRCHLQPCHVAHFGLAIFEAVRQTDLSPVLFPGHRVLDWLGPVLDCAGQRQTGSPPFAIGVELDWQHERSRAVRCDRGENLEDRPAVLSTGDRDDGLPLPGTRTFIDNQLQRTIALVDRARE